MGPLIADLIVLLQKNRQACFSKDSYREPKIHELLAWERKNYDENNNNESQSSSASAMAISKTP
jgi:hypothetical protein